MKYIIQYNAGMFYIVMQDSYGNLYDTMRHFKTKTECYNFIKKDKEK